MQIDISVFWFYWYILLGNLFEQMYWYFDFIDLSRSETFSSKYINFLILLKYLARKLFRVNISIFLFYWYISLENFPSKYINFWFYWYILLGNLFKQIYRFFNLLIYLAQIPFWASILIFWFYQYILLINLSERIYRYFDFIDVSCLETFSSDYIDFLILLIYLAWKPFWASILNFWFYLYFLLGNLFKRVYRYFDFFLISCSETFQASIFIFRVGP